MIVIDASIVTKVINLQEEGSDKAIELVRGHIEGKEEIIIPSLLFLEVANALATKSQVKEAHIKEGINSLYKMKFRVYDVKEEDVVDSSLLARKYKTSVYDMIYAVLAKKNNAILITADEKFADKVDFPFVKILSTFK